ncbi:DUF2207 domain-containing protein [Bacillus sp. DX4.1]|uniref:phage tail protein n=1 Tax=Bacillus sp. DX4.1 TaxID=3055867 RepID=UPI0025A251F7|nr:DUF2207 domain-containing protein [Bacillus sp. DX4.1]MDM5189353.1 DUF2207 domain-containing protein [Bacillus sp. DX4.1]
MAGSRIKGITVEIGGDTVGLQNALKDVNQRSNDLAKELKDVERLLKFNPGNVEALAQKQQLLTQRIEATTEKLNQLKAAEQQVQAQFERGDISAEQYRAFRREIEYTEGSLGGLQNQLKNMRDEQERAARTTRELDTLFDATGTSVEQFANILGGRLTAAIRQGTATSAQLDEAIERIGRASLGTEADLDRLRRSLSSIDDGNSIENVRNELRELSREAERAGDNFKELDIDLENMLGAMIAGGGIAGTIEQALDMSKLKTKIDITFEVPESSKKSVEEAVRGIEAYGVDGEAALEGVRRQWALNKNVSDEANAAIVKSAASIASSYEGIDFTELIQETNEVASELGISQEGAMGLTDALLKVGFPSEQLDIIAEYGGQLTRAGYNAEEVQAIMEAGVETGTWNIDNLLDGLKEGRIKAAEFAQGVDKAMTEALEGTNISAEQLQKWGQSVAKGGKEGSAAMTEIAKALDSIEDETKRNEIGVKLFGTIYEDQGQNITNTLLGAQEKTIDFKKNQDQLNESIKKMDANPAVKMQKALGDLKMALEPVLSVVADLVAKFAEWISNNPTLAATLAAVATAIGIIVGAFMALAPIVVTISSIGLALSGWIALFAIIIAAVVGLVIAIVKNWDSIKAWTIDTWNAIKDYLIGLWDGLVQWLSDTWNSMSEGTASAWNSIVEFLTGIWNSLVQSLSEIWNSIVQTTTEVWSSIIEFLIGVWDGVVQTLSETWNSISETTFAVWTAISEFFIGVWNGIVVFLTPILQGIADFFSMIWNGISTVIQTVWNFITQYLQAIWTAILYFATPIFEGLKNFLISIWDAISLSITTIWNAVVSFLQICWNGIVSIATTIFETLKLWILSVWDTISSVTMTVWNTVSTFLQTCWNALVSIVTPIFESIKNWIVNTWNTISSTTSAVWDTIKNFLSSLWNSMVSTATSIFNSIKEAISSVWNMISSTSSSIWNGIKSTLSSIWEGIKSTASSVWNGLKEAIMTPVSWVTDAVSGAFEGMKSAVLGVWDGIKSGIRTVINGIISMINKFIDGFNTPANLLNKVPGVDAPTIPHVPMLAKGGKPVGDGSFITGEAGPELFTKKGNSITVTPLSSKEKSLGITGTMNQMMSDMSRMMASSMSQLSGLKSVMSGVYGSMANSRQSMSGNTIGAMSSPGMNVGGYAMSTSPQDVVVQVVVDQPVVVDGRTVQRVVRKENFREDNINFLKRG